MPRYPSLDQIRALPQTHSAFIPEDYLDSMGHMNVMWYTHLFSRGMGGLFNLVGLTRDYLQQNNAGTFALEGHVRYIAEVRVGQEISIHSRLIARSIKRFHAVHFMVNESLENLAATLESVNAHIDMSRRRTSPWPPGITNELDRLMAQHQNLEWESPLCGAMRV